MEHPTLPQDAPTAHVVHAADALSATAPRAGRRGLAALLIVEAVLAFVPVAILGAAIDWPGSLGHPAARQMEAIAAHPLAVALGYGVYLLYSILVAPAMIGLAAFTFAGLHRPIAATVAAFGAMSALARSIGILRWLTVMPQLASAHGAAEPGVRAQLERLFDGLTAYGGGIGEVLGVSVLMAAAMLTLTLGALPDRAMPRSLALAGVVVALLLLGLGLPVLRGPALVPVALAVSLLSVWMCAAGVWIWRGR